MNAEFRNTRTGETTRWENTAITWRDSDGAPVVYRELPEPWEEAPRDWQPFEADEVEAACPVCRPGAVADGARPVRCILHGGGDEAIQPTNASVSGFRLDGDSDDAALDASEDAADADSDRRDFEAGDDLTWRDVCGRVITIPRHAADGPPVEDVLCRLLAGHAGDHEGEAESAGPITWENTAVAGDWREPRR